MYFHPKNTFSYEWICEQNLLQIVIKDALISQHMTFYKKIIFE
jgi:hypothetical protein